jgi:hypothetical protein
MAWPYDVDPGAQLQRLLTPLPQGATPDFGQLQRAAPPTMAQANIPAQPAMPQSTRGGYFGPTHQALSQAVQGLLSPPQPQNAMPPMGAPYQLPAPPAAYQQAPVSYAPDPKFARINWNPPPAEAAAPAVIPDAPAQMLSPSQVNAWLYQIQGGSADGGTNGEGGTGGVGGSASDGGVGGGGGTG